MSFNKAFPRSRLACRHIWRIVSIVLADVGRASSLWTIPVLAGGGGHGQAELCKCKEGAKLKLTHTHSFLSACDCGRVKCQVPADLGSPTMADGDLELGAEINPVFLICHSNRNETRTCAHKLEPFFFFF